MEPFKEIVLVALGKRDSLSRQFSPEEWQAVFTTAKRHAVLGITFKGVERLSRDNRPPKNLLLNWIYVADKTRAKNALIEERAAQATSLLAVAGFQSCLLKGAAAARYYNSGLSCYRASGDIDIWVDSGVREVYSFLRSKYPIGDKVYHHVDAYIFNDVKTEMHFKPSFAYSPTRIRRYNRWFAQQAGRQFGRAPENGIVYPDDLFNAVYFLLHIFRHVLTEGVGFRQLMDYYFLLTNLSAEVREEAMKTLRWMGLGKFTAAVMYVIKELFCDEENPEDKLELLCEPDVKLGAFLLNEVVQAGNFGHFDERLAPARHHGQLSRWKSFERLVSVFRLSPSEVLCAPFWKLWHWCWRKINFK